MTEKEDSDLKGDVNASESWLISLSRDCGKALGRSKSGIDALVDATGCAAKTTKQTTESILGYLSRGHGLSSSEEALFQELGSKVAQCPAGDYLSLQYDAEFWTLVRQLHSIRRKVVKRAVAEEEWQEDETITFPRESDAEAELQQDAIETPPEEADVDEEPWQDETETSPEESDAEAELEQDATETPPEEADVDEEPRQDETETSPEQSESHSNETGEDPSTAS